MNNTANCQPKSIDRQIDPVEAKVAMLRNGVSVIDLAKKYNVSRWMIYKVIRNLSQSARIKSALARDLGEGIFLPD